MMVVPIFSCKLCGGTPVRSKEFKNSVGQFVATSSLVTKSIDLNECRLVGILLWMNDSNRPRLCSLPLKPLAHLANRDLSNCDRCQGILSWWVILLMTWFGKNSVETKWGQSTDQLVFGHFQLTTIGLRIHRLIDRVVVWPAYWVLTAVFSHISINAMPSSMRSVHRPLLIVEWREVFDKNRRPTKSSLHQRVWCSCANLAVFYPVLLSPNKSQHYLYQNLCKSGEVEGNNYQSTIWIDQFKQWMVA